MSDPVPINASVHGPYEDLAIEIVKLIGKISDGQPPDVRAELWRMTLNNLKFLDNIFQGRSGETKN